MPAIACIEQLKIHYTVIDDDDEHQTMITDTTGETTASYAPASEANL